MARPPKGQRCENCRYWREFDEQVPAYGRSEENNLLGWCMRNPPITVGEPDHQRAPGLFPCVAQRQWCGEYAPANPETVTEGAATLARLVLLGDLTAARALADKLKDGDS